jgi:hypothetical protein
VKPGDSIVLYLILAILFYFLIRRWLPVTFWDWLTNRQKKQVPTIEGRVPRILVENGYQPIEEKKKIAMKIEFDDHEPYESRLFVDYIAKKEDDYFLVFVENARKPLQQYGAGLRDTFLAHYLLYRPSGMLYVKKDQSIHVITFDIENLLFAKKKRRTWGYALFFLLGVIVAWLSSFV